MIAREVKKLEPNKPVSLYTLLGKMAAKKQFIEQAYSFSEEYWSCQRELAELEREFDKANQLWMSHQNEDRRTNQKRTG